MVNFAPYTNIIMFRELFLDIHKLTSMMIYYLRILSILPAPVVKVHWAQTKTALAF